MTTVSGKRINASAQLKMKAALRAMFASMSRELATMLVMRAGLDGQIDQREEEVIRREARDITAKYFVNPSPFAADGVTPSSPFASILTKFYVRVVGQNVQQHAAWLKRNMPDDLYRWLTTAVLPDGVPQRETISPDALRRLLLAYDPMHLWVDPNGYRLSDRIWNTSDVTRKAIDDLLMEGIRIGEDARTLAKKLERFLNPDAAKVRSRNRLLNGNANTLRLARTEITRASNQAANLAAQLNPYVEFIDIARSRRGDSKCPICPTHATIGIDGQRVRDPYLKENAPIPGFHPNCRCATIPVTAAEWRAVTEDLRRGMLAGETAPLTPAAGEPLSPAPGQPVVAGSSGNRLLKWALGGYLFNRWLQDDAA